MLAESHCRPTPPKLQHARTPSLRRACANVPCCICGPSGLASPMVACLVATVLLGDRSASGCRALTCPSKGLRHTAGCEHAVLWTTCRWVPVMIKHLGEAWWATLLADLGHHYAMLCGGEHCLCGSTVHPREWRSHAPQLCFVQCLMWSRQQRSRLSWDVIGICRWSLLLCSCQAMQTPNSGVPPLVLLSAGCPCCVPARHSAHRTVPLMG